MCAGTGIVMRALVLSCIIIVFFGPQIHVHLCHSTAHCSALHLLTVCHLCTLLVLDRDTDVCMNYKALNETEVLMGVSSGVARASLSKRTG